MTKFSKTFTLVVGGGSKGFASYKTPGNGNTVYLPENLFPSVTTDGQTVYAKDAVITITAAFMLSPADKAAAEQAAAAAVAAESAAVLVTRNERIAQLEAMLSEAAAAVAAAESAGKSAGKSGK